MASKGKTSAETTSNIKNDGNVDKKRKRDIREDDSLPSSNKSTDSDEKQQKHLEANANKKLQEEAERKERIQKALEGIKSLLGLSEKYSEYLSMKLTQRSKSSGNILAEKNQPDEPSTSSGRKATRASASKKAPFDITKQLRYFEGGTLRPYQIEGATWMTMLYENSINGILADEMGLGKTVQIIALICHLVERKIKGPFLIVVPLSTIPNWQAEFARFAPKIPVVVFHGNRDERIEQYVKIEKLYNFEDRKLAPVVITTFQMPMMENIFLKKFSWQYIIIDEGHRIKNYTSKLALALKALKSANRLLLTGTPLQNNITELWSLFNFLMPELFNDQEHFSSLIILDDMKDKEKIIEQEMENNIISTIHKVLAPFMLRRVKRDVEQNMVPKKDILIYCPLSQLQRDLYTHVLERNIYKLMHPNAEEADNKAEIDCDTPTPKRKCTLISVDYRKINEGLAAPTINTNASSGFSRRRSSSIQGKERKDGKAAEYICRLTMQSIGIMLKKVVNHPYLIHFPVDPDTHDILIDDNLIHESGKMMILDTLLAKLKERGHKVLIFSTMVMILDIIEELIIMRNYNYQRLDGSKSLSTRDDSIKEFNTNKDVFTFLISTRAGGLGLNLTAADTVIFFDRDWNPQVDLQAQDRCHRIGQTRPVVVYTLVSKNTIDERILARGEIKRRLEKIVIKDGQFKTINKVERNKLKSELLDLQELLNKKDDTQKIHSNGCFSEKEWDKLLDRSALYQEMVNKENQS